MAVQLPPSLTLPQKFERLTFTEYVSSDNMSTPSTPGTPCTPPTEAYEIEVIKEEEEEDVLNFLNKFFFRDEPLNIYLKMLENDNNRCYDLERYCVKNLKNGLSLKAVSASGNIIGLCLNNIITREGTDDFECNDAKFQKIIDLLETVDEQADVFGKYPDVDKILNINILSVDSSWRGRRIAQELIARTREIAIQNGCKALMVDCTSNYSARAAKRLGFECVYTLNYEDYKVNGETVFKPEKPHSAVTVFTQRI